MYIMICLNNFVISLTHSYYSYTLSMKHGRLKLVNLITVYMYSYILTVCDLLTVNDVQVALRYL